MKVTVNDKQCEPMQVTVKAGKTQFIIQNHSQKALEWGDPERGNGGRGAGKHRAVIHAKIDG